MPVRRIGVLGAGTMGSGIAEVAVRSGFATVLYDVAPDIVARARAGIEGNLTRHVQRGRLTDGEAKDALGRLALATRLEEMATADLVIEAAPEDLLVKRDLFRALDAIVRSDTVLASNTSSLSITALAAAAADPGRVVGMHFFNPAPVMALVEIVPGRGTRPEVEEIALDVARALGKTPVRAKDTPGFIVNRIARPYYLEALRLLGEGVAAAAEIDRIMRLAGFRMGPFELLDLIGLDVNLAVTKSIYEASFHEPRYRPHPLQEQMVAAGLLGRKAGQGFYRYVSEGQPATAAESTEEPVEELSPPRRVVILDSVWPLSDQLAQATEAAGIAVERMIPDYPGNREIDLVVDASLPSSPQEKRDRVAAVASRSRLLRPEPPVLTLSLAYPASVIGGDYDRPISVVGFATLPPFGERGAVEVIRGLRTSPEAVASARAYFRALGKQTVVIGDGAGGVFPRIFSMIVNEAAFALTEGVASVEDIDTALRLGANYPYGPLAAADRVGVDVVLVILEGLQREGGDAYRPAPLLRRMVASHWTGGQFRGFYERET